MKLAISNIAWDENVSPIIYEKMQSLGFTGLEIAPSKIFGSAPYEQIKNAIKFKNQILKKYGLTICSMQSIWFGRTEQIFKNKEERKLLQNYTKKAIEYAEAIGCKNLVFGCPKNRVIYNKDDIKIALDFFSKLGEYAVQHNTVLAIEANPQIYNTNFITHTEEAFMLAKEVNNSGFKVNYDFGTAIYNKESLEILKDNISLVNHIHISEPYLAAVTFSEKHKKLLHILSQTDYKNFISIEMKMQSLEYVIKCLEDFKNLFEIG